MKSRIKHVVIWSTGMHKGRVLVMVAVTVNRKSFGLGKGHAVVATRQSRGQA